MYPEARQPPSTPARAHPPQRRRWTHIKPQSLSKVEKLRVLEKQNFNCPCGRTITLGARRLRDWKKILGHYPDKSVPSQAKFHHLKWRAKGGSDNPSNILACCGFCHTRKAHDVTYLQRHYAGGAK